MANIATLTLNPAVDKSCRVDQVMAERKLRCDDVQFHPGGGGINVARAIAELGGQVTAYWTCGGPQGQLLTRLLDDDGIEHQPIAIRCVTRENLIVYEDSSGQQFRFGMPGAQLSNDEVQNCLHALQAAEPPADYVVLSGSVPQGVDESVYARIAEAMGSECRLVLDTSGLPLELGLRASVYLIKPNVNELGQLAGHPIEDDAGIRNVARELLDEGKVRVVVTSLGSGGAVVTTADEHQHIRAPTVKIRSKVGAGDSTVAGMVLAMARGKSLVESVRFGVAAGSAAVMTGGTDLCRREEVEQLYQTLCAS
jgi:6-phosphofructokinase 2